MKVAIYARVSTDKQDLDNQVSQLIDYVTRRQDLELYAIYQDIYTGTSDTRPQFNMLLNDLRHYKFHAVIVTKIDRLARSLKHLITLMDEFQNKRVELITTTQAIDTTSPQGKLTWQIMGAFAEFERELISQRTKEGLKGKKNVGKRGKDKKPRKKRGVLRK